MHNPLSLKELAKKYSAEDEHYLFGQFLDDFRNEKTDKYSLIKDEPPAKNGMELFACILAATAHKLANDNGLPVPDWVWKNRYISSKAEYAFDTGIEDYKRHLELTSPAEFTTRNLFFGDNIISRI
jgi:hypothetical protein